MTMLPESTTDTYNLADYAMLSNVEIGILAELDHRKISFRELLVLDAGSILILGRAVGENIDVYVDRVLIGNGEIMVVDENLAVRLADLRDKPSATQITDELIQEERAAPTA